MKETAIRASLDRFEGEYAVIYSDAGIGKFDVPREMLGKGVKPGMRLLLYLDGDRVARVKVDNKATEDAKDRIRRKYAGLARKKGEPSS
ncbi:MAG TPA: DUF3006 domain-containing protein [Nitrososphaera sp.]|nr:DUF3006 domain-containing protein [Nitrososphaera sp.]